MYNSRRICDVWINIEKYEENGPTYVWEQIRAKKNSLAVACETYIREEYLRFSLGRLFYGATITTWRLLYLKWVKITCECVLIPKIEYIIVFGVNLKLGINLKSYCNWFDNSEIIRSLLHDFCLQGRNSYPRKLLCSCVFHNLAQR